MEENLPRASGKTTKKPKKPKKTTPTPSRNTRFSTEDQNSDIDCSGKQCHSCAAALIADCVAICCCPLALVSLLALAFVKAPYLVGRRCIKRRREKRKRSRQCKDHDHALGSVADHGQGDTGLGFDKSDIIFEFGVEEEDELEERKSFCAAFEADKVLFELYQVGHLGFGRVSFTGIHSFGKGS